MEIEDGDEIIGKAVEKTSPVYDDTSHSAAAVRPFILNHFTHSNTIDPFQFLTNVIWCFQILPIQSLLNSPANPSLHNRGVTTTTPPSSPPPGPRTPSFLQRIAGANKALASPVRKGFEHSSNPSSPVQSTELSVHPPAPQHSSSFLVRTASPSRRSSPRNNDTNTSTGFDILESAKEVLPPPTVAPRSRVPATATTTATITPLPTTTPPTPVPTVAALPPVPPPLVPYTPTSPTRVHTPANPHTPTSSGSSKTPNLLSLLDSHTDGRRSPTKMK